MLTPANPATNSVASDTPVAAVAPQPVSQPTAPASTVAVSLDIDAQQAAASSTAAPAPAKKGNFFDTLKDIYADNKTLVNVVAGVAGGMAISNARAKNDSPQNGTVQQHGNGTTRR